eukprot:CAMPEP_0201566030 /NCGR_PEP_ID=MMETSP0190_2-20130828/5530_1 /ASSEMBLY_ACC=CAM_ASM_000263 /TAXON_ID=37353 /ORGANISM="Rosalina sp." /LENGTH=30 /DNA_ID= /DNA_START= /DNA_END= /DNA_ORIENTATION=
MGLVVVVEVEGILVFVVRELLEVVVVVYQE